MNTLDWSPLGWTGWISLQSKGLSRVFFNTTVQKHQFFGAQPSSQSNFHIHMTTGKTIAFTRRTFVGKVMSLLFNMMFRLSIKTWQTQVHPTSFCFSFLESDCHTVSKSRILYRREKTHGVSLRVRHSMERKPLERRTKAALPRSQINTTSSLTPPDTMGSRTTT